MLTFIEFMDERNGHYETRPAENIAARSRNDATVAALRGASDQINLAEAVHCGYYYGCGYYRPYIYYRPYGYYRPYYRQYGHYRAYRYRPYFSYPYRLPPPVH